MKLQISEIIKYKNAIFCRNFCHKTLLFLPQTNSRGSAAALRALRNGAHLFPLSLADRRAPFRRERSERAESPAENHENTPKAC
jgi:hypothetical protein